MNKLFLGILAVLGIVGFIALMAFYHAFVLATLWGWFVTPFGVTAINMAHAYGLSLIPSVILSSRGLHAPEDKRLENAVSALIIPAVALLLGWIALGFMY